MKSGGAPSGAPPFFCPGIRPVMTSAFHTAADSAMSRNDLPEAIGHLEQATATDPSDFDAWMKLAALRRHIGDHVQALAAANSALDARPNEFVALLLKGKLHEQLGEHGRAAEVYRAVLHHAAEIPNLPAPIQAQLEQARQFLHQQRSNIEATMPSMAALDPIHRARAERFLENVLDRRPIYTHKPTHYHYPDQPSIEYFDFAYHELKQRMRAAFPAILAELQALLAERADCQQPYVNFSSGQPMAQFEPLNRNPAWNAFHLIRYGEVDHGLAAACPNTMKLFSNGEQPDVTGLTPNLMFSLLAPHTRIPAHVGVANFRVVFHLPLIVPDKCFFRVGADTRRWVEGEPWIFDDSVEHEAWNDSDELRVILMGDLWRPGLDETDRQIVRGLLSAKAFNSEIGAL